MNPLVRVQLDVPRDLVRILDATESELGPRLMELVVIELFREDQISSGKAANVLGLSKESFIQLLGRRGVPYFTETQEELERQTDDLRQRLSARSS